MHGDAGQRAGQVAGVDEPRCDVSIAVGAKALRARCKRICAGVVQNHVIAVACAL
jgi:hypothetical protein